jgi:uncharacterized protein
MDKERILSILQDWNLWSKDLEAGVERGGYLDRMQRAFNTGQILVMTGARRSGKSYLMRQFARRLVCSGMEPKNILIVNFEDPRLPKMDSKGFFEIFDLYLEYLEPQGTPLLLLDEVQEVTDWERAVTTLQELKKAKVIVSGSNAKLISDELSTYLTGRHLDIGVFPLDFGEYLSFKDIRANGKMEKATKAALLKKSLNEYLECGGFPAAAFSPERNAILLAQFEDVLNKDLIRRYKIRKTEMLRSLLNFYLSNISCEVTYNSLERSMGISEGTVNKFSRYFENVYLLFFLKRFSFKVKEQDKSPRKVYSIDTGMAATVGFRFSENVGRLAENLVFLELARRKALHGDMELFYWRDQKHNEVDFVIKSGRAVRQLVQVCWKVEDQAVRDREELALVQAAKDLRCEDLLVLTEEREETAERLGKKIVYTPIWKWMLGNK